MLYLKRIHMDLVSKLGQLIYDAHKFSLHLEMLASYIHRYSCGEPP